MYYYNLAKVWQHGNIKYRNLSALVQSSFPILEDTLDFEGINLSKAVEVSQKSLYLHEKLKSICLQGGGEKGQILHTKKNKKILPREKLNQLFDSNSTSLELCLQAGLGMEYGDIPGASAISVIGKIEDNYVLVTANDGTLKGGTFFPITLKKTLRAQDVSRVNLLPKIYLVDSGGAFLPLQADLFPDKLHGGRGFYNQAVGSSMGIPQLALVCGSCTAGGAYVPMMCQDSGIVHKIGTIYLGGPPLVKAATGELVSGEDLGGATLHCSVSGCSDYFAATEEEGFKMLRDTVSTLDISPPQSQVQEVNPLYEPKELDVLCGVDKLCKDKLKGLIARLVDGSRFREFKQMYGRNLLAGYAFIDHTRVGIVANCGPLIYEDGLKGSHFLQICSQRNIPVIFLQNSGPKDEFWADMSALNPSEASLRLRGRATMISAVAGLDVPKISVNVGGCHGDDIYSMCGPSFSPNFIFCWPGTEMSCNPPLPSELSQIQPKEPKKSKAAFNFETDSSWYWASRAITDGIITPSETRKTLTLCLRIFDQKKRINCKETVFPVFRF